MLRPKFILTTALICFSGLAAGAENLGESDQNPSYKELKKEWQDMRLPNVAWRNIEWKTCLLEALRASRKKNKPLILWIFIDLPIDDKRC